MSVRARGAVSSADFERKGKEVSTLEFYQERAAQCAREAEATNLVNVRDRLLNARLTWLQMAERLERTNESRAVGLAHKAEALAQAAKEAEMATN